LADASDPYLAPPRLSESPSWQYFDLGRMHLNPAVLIIDRIQAANADVSTILRHRHLSRALASLNSIGLNLRDLHLTRRA
jgi:hypothetical protein